MEIMSTQFAQVDSVLGTLAHLPEPVCHSIGQNTDNNTDMRHMIDGQSGAGVEHLLFAVGPDGVTGTRTNY